MKKLFKKKLSIVKFTVAKLNNPKGIVGGNESGHGGGQTDGQGPKTSIICGILGTQ